MESVGKLLGDLDRASQLVTSVINDAYSRGTLNASHPDFETAMDRLAALAAAHFSVCHDLETLRERGESTLLYVDDPVAHLEKPAQHLRPLPTPELLMYLGMMKISLLNCLKEVASPDGHVSQSAVRLVQMAISASERAVSELSTVPAGN